jgi:hypothetical protein
MSQKTIGVGPETTAQDNSARYDSQRISNYCSNVLNSDEMNLHFAQGHGSESIYAHARAKRLINEPEKIVFRHLLNHHLVLLDQAHYVRTERIEWMPFEKYALGKHLRHDPDNLELAKFILEKSSPSELYRYYYFFRFPDRVQLDRASHLPSDILN